MNELESLNKNQLKIMKAHFEAVIADAQRKLENIEELLQDELTIIEGSETCDQKEKK